MSGSVLEMQFKCKKKRSLLELEIKQNKQMHYFTQHSHAAMSLHLVEDFIS